MLSFFQLPTLFNDDLSLNLAGMRRHVRFLIDHGLHEGNAVLLVNGANGEFPMLTLEERKQTAEAVVGEANGRIAVIVSAEIWRAHSQSLVTMGRVRMRSEGSRRDGA